MTRNCDICKRAFKRTEIDVCCKCKLDTYMKNAPLIDNVLMYANHHRNGSTTDLLVRTIGGFYSNDEINDAKTLIYERFGALNLLQNEHDRRGSQNRSEMMAICSDIIDDLFKPEENDINITCCAVNWMRIPKIAHEEIINISTADKLAEMEAKFMFHDNALSEIRRENATIENRMNGIEKSIGPDKSAYPSKTPTPSANSVSAPTPSTSTPSTPTPSTPTPSTPTPSTSTATTPTPSAPTPSEYSASTPTPSASTSSEPSSNAPISSAHTPRAFLTSKPDVHADVTPAAPESYVTVLRRSYPKRLNLTSNKSARVSNASRESESRVSKESYNARRYVRRGGITGNSTSGGLRATPLPVRDLFVYRENSDDTTDVLSGYLRSHGIVTKLCYYHTEFQQIFVF